MNAETETIPNVCAVCHATDDREPVCNRGSEDAPYYLCIDRQACTDRATAQQREARDAEEAVMRAVVNEKQALEADVEAVKAEVRAEGKHAATGPLQAVTDTAVAEMTEAAKAGEDADGEASDD